jgi:hypothetical protein
MVVGLRESTSPIEIIKPSRRMRAFFPARPGDAWSQPDLPGTPGRRHRQWSSSEKSAATCSWQVARTTAPRTMRLSLLRSGRWLDLEIAPSELT